MYIYRFLITGYSHNFILINQDSHIIFLLHIVDPSLLICEDDQENGDGSESDPSEDVADDDNDAVCATHGVTYPSLCRLLQDTGNEAVAYAGECDREECEGGNVSNTKG